MRVRGCPSLSLSVSPLLSLSCLPVLPIVFLFTGYGSWTAAVATEHSHRSSRAHSKGEAQYCSVVGGDVDARGVWGWGT
jgi:hypothetical protein